MHWERKRMKIHSFLPRNQVSRDTFSSLHCNELLLRNLNPSGSIEHRRFRLREALDRKLLICESNNTIEHFKSKVSVLYTIICAIPYILHTENRMGLKFIWLIQEEGVANAKRRLIEGCQQINGEKIDGSENI